ncbi:MAG: hypothetical protein GY938_05135, partial [Ketobacter sp.]|nr:hypothetical protein [Ketobacter sp.]
TTLITGEKYCREQESIYSRSGTTPFSVLMDYGRIQLNLNRVKWNNDGQLETKTVLEELTSKGDVQLTEELKDNVRYIITHTTYRRVTKILNVLKGMGFKKDVLWDIVQELGITACETYPANPKDYDIVMVDGSGGKGKHVWYAFIGLNTETGQMFPLHHSVGVSLSDIKQELDDKGLVNRNHILIADGETGIHLEFKGYRIQMCAFHFEQALCYKLWEDGMSLKERKEINSKIQTILNTLKNSVIKNAGKNHKRIEGRIEKTKEQLTTIANNLTEQGFKKVGRFIMKHLDTVTLFAQEAVNLVKVPWTNNIMERFIGEVAFRIKNIWAHWSQTGLNSIIHLIIINYCKRNRVILEF